MKGGHVNSVTGPLSTESLGQVLIHEHLFVDLKCYWQPEDDPEIAFRPMTWENMGEIRSSPFASRMNLSIDEPWILANELMSLGSHGKVTIVDATPRTIGGDPRAARWLAQTTGINVICGSGFYIKQSHPFEMANRDRDDITAEIVDDLTVGIAHTDIKAGVIGEIGVSASPAHAVEKKVIEAAVEAHKETGAALIMHSAPGSESPIEVVETLEALGADMTKVIQSHLDDRFRDDLEAYQRVAATGANLGLDTFGRELYNKQRKRQHPTDEQRIDALLMLIEAGLSEQIILSQDICLRHELKSYGGRGYNHLFSRIVPRLLDRGLFQDDIDQLTRRNPSRILLMD